MEETILIYTKYYSEAVIEVLDRFDLNIQIVCLSSYDKILAYLKTAPNVRGIIFLEYKTRRFHSKAYRSILTAADEIAESTRQPFCVSIISNNNVPGDFVSHIFTRNIEVFFTKYLMFNTDYLRFEGLATVILHTIGVADNSILLEMDDVDTDASNLVGRSKTGFLNHCLHITTSDKSGLENFAESIKIFPELEKLIYLRNNGDKDEKIIGSSENLFKVFALKCIERRIADERKGALHH